MSRYEHTIAVGVSIDERIHLVEEYLESEGFRRQPDRSWQKGQGFLMSPLFVDVTAIERSVRLQGWVRFTILPGVYIGEMGVDGLFYAVPKKRLKRHLQAIEAILGEPHGSP